MKCVRADGEHRGSRVRTGLSNCVHHEVQMTRSGAPGE